MRKNAKEYMDHVAETLAKKYNISEIESYKMIKSSFLYDSLLKFPDETIHDDYRNKCRFCISGLYFG